MAGVGFASGEAPTVGASVIYKIQLLFTLYSYSLPHAARTLERKPQHATVASVSNDTGAESSCKCGFWSRGTVLWSTPCHKLYMGVKLVTIPFERAHIEHWQDGSSL